MLFLPTNAPSWAAVLPRLFSAFTLAPAPSNTLVVSTDPKGYKSATNVLWIIWPMIKLIRARATCTCSQPFLYAMKN